MNVRLWEAEGHVWKLQILFFSPLNRKQIFRNTAMNIGVCIFTLHPEQHTICSDSSKLLNNIESDSLLGRAIW